MITIDGNTGTVVQHEASLEKLKPEVKELPTVSLGSMLSVGLSLFARYLADEALKTTRKNKKRLKRRRINPAFKKL